MIKLAVFDLDKTLLNDEGMLPANFAECQNKLAQMGVKLAVATTRPWEQVKKLFGDSFPEIIGICDNGSRIFIGEKYELLHRFKQSEILELVDYVKMNADIALLLSGEKQSYLDPRSAERFYKHDKMWLFPGCLDIEKYFNGNDDICNVNFFCFSSGKQEDVSELVAHNLKMILQKLTKRYNLMPAGYGWISVLPINAGKRLGLQTLMERIHAHQDDTVVFGDSENDVPMFSLVTHSYAMQNAEKSVKEKATYITKEDNNHNGALNALLDHLMSAE